ncbi:hypothetical protein G5714_006892 [Onychostoma macrolepis]|uniref:Retrotransposon gag domain-containing protein n=1 Tax=Onychostoma macrolepis TaxID=369639 RepID=A0A7J6CXP0_9TELE|nr:hypothetical protein G5714_006892 [Onychostoma macrolepis]
MGPAGKFLNVRQGDRSIEDYARDFVGVARQSAAERTCLMTFFWGGLAEPFRVQGEDSVNELHSNGDTGYAEDRSPRGLPVPLAEPTAASRSPSADITPGRHTIPIVVHPLDKAFLEERPGRHTSPKHMETSCSRPHNVQEHPGLSLL